MMLEDNPYYLAIDNEPGTICKRCKTEGHKAANCPEKKKQVRSNAFSIRCFL